MRRNSCFASKFAVAAVALLLPAVAYLGLQYQIVTADERFQREIDRSNQHLPEGKAADESRQMEAQRLQEQWRQSIQEASAGVSA